MMKEPTSVPLRGFDRLLIPFLISLPIALGIGTYFLVAYWGSFVAWRAFISALISRPLYYTIMGGLGSYLIKDIGPAKAYIVMGFVLLGIDVLYKMPVNVMFDIAFIASMIMVLLAATEETS